MFGKKRVKKGSMGEFTNAVGNMYANISLMSPDNPIKTIAVTSVEQDEGKSTTSVELARVIAASGQRVVLVECDMRRRSLANILGAHSRGGFYSAITGKASLGDIIAPTKVPNLFFIDVEPGIPSPTQVLSSDAFKSMHDSLKVSFDYVIFDTPPLDAFADAAVLGSIVDGVILVTRPGSSHRDALENAAEQLRLAKANILGLCATFCEATGSDSYYAYTRKKKHNVHRGIFLNK